MYICVYSIDNIIIYFILYPFVHIKLLIVYFIVRATGTVLVRSINAINTASDCEKTKKNITKSNGITWAGGGDRV